jgi:hypothetical protein
MAAETGIIGAGLFLLFLTALIISAVKAIRFFDKGLSRDLFIGITAGTTGFLAHCTVDTHLYSVTLSAFLFLCLGIIVAFSKLTHEKPAV